MKDEMRRDLSSFIARLARLFAAVCMVAFLSACSTSRPPVAEPDVAVALFPEPSLDLIAFGSCVGQDEPQPIWDAVVAQSPDLFLFLGDNIYADTDDMGVMREKYETQSRQSGIRQIFASTPVMATWDDHDYGQNDAGAEYPQKEKSQAEFLRFFAVPELSPRWNQDGVYHSQTFGPPGRRVQVIMLDTRYFRSPLQRWPDAERPTIGPYKPSTDSTATVLGETQWRWLADELREPADVRVIATSIQAVASEHGFEAWVNFPLERQRLFKLIRETGASGVVLVSGDRHLAEISLLPADDPAGPGYPLYDVTASSINRPNRFSGLEPNRHRVHEDNYKEVNYGTIGIDWTGEPTLRMQIRDIDGKVQLESTARLSALQSGAAGE
jgi:alkaline phosphatase D